MSISGRTEHCSDTVVLEFSPRQEKSLLDANFVAQCFLLSFVVAGTLATFFFRSESLVDLLCLSNKKVEDSNCKYS